MQPWFRNRLSPLYAEPPLFASSDPQETKHATSTALKEHDLIWRSGKVNSYLRKLKLGGFSLFLLRYGASVHIEPGELQDFLLFQVPLVGSACITVGDSSIMADQRTGVIISPTLALQLDWSEDCEQLLLKIPRERIELTCSNLLDMQIEKPIEFEPLFVLDTPLGLSWQHQISALLYASGEHPSALPARWMQAQEEALIQHLLLCHRHNYSELLERRSHPARRNVRLAEEYIHSHLQEPLDLAGIATAGGMSVRSLCAAFNEHHGQSPMVYVRDQRLARAHADLLCAEPGTKVTDVALRWGFSHLGRFCARYRDRYGKTPLQTLQQ